MASFGGKSRVTDVVWQAFGDTPNYVEAFCGSAAMLLGRPHAPRIETINDADCYVSNFYRAVQADPIAVAKFCDRPVNEADLSAIHIWLVNRDDFRERMKTDPEYYDPQVAGWWVWGLCSWIGSGWCAAANDDSNIHRKLPHLGDAGRGVNRQLPHLGNAGMGIQRQAAAIADWMLAISDRMRRVRVACGDWTRVLGDSVTWRHGVTGVFLDPPYDDGKVDYSAGGRGVSADVLDWCVANGDNPKLRIALCGYEGEHVLPTSWRAHAWKAHGGFGGQRADGVNENAHRERIWFSPNCLPLEAKQTSLFDVKVPA